MSTPVDMQGVIEKVSLHKTSSAMGTEAANLAMTHLAGGEAGDNAVLEAECGIHIIEGTITRATTCSGQTNH